MGTTRYVRFVTHRIDDDSLTWQGIFHGVTELRREDGLASYMYDWLDRDLGWLNENLPVPPCYREADSRTAICWFRPDAHEPIARARSLAALLREHGRPVVMLRSRMPGRVVYEDRWQVVAEPRPRVAWRRKSPRGRKRQTRQSRRLRIATRVVSSRWPSA